MHSSVVPVGVINIMLFLIYVIVCLLYKAHDSGAPAYFAFVVLSSGS